MTFSFRATSLALCLLALTACGGRGYVATANSSTQVLPLEVFGADGTERSINLLLTAEQVARATAVSLRVHALSHEGKASLRIGKGDWIPLNNDRVSVPGVASVWGGIGGPLATLDIRLPIPAAALTAGPNALTFRLDRLNAISIGFRVLAINVLDGSGAELLAPSAFKQDDPSTWAAPDGADPNSGAILWATAQLQQGPSSTTKLRAKCSDCHADDGRDLKYFNYSNFAIVERAKFYGLSEEQGKDIAAYIRKLKVPAPGRPWNPPYQPGPGLTDRALENFSAGAGIDALVDEDATIAAIFKDGFDRSSLAEGNALRRIHMSDVPIALQLPDWNRWLPAIHPKDSIGDGFERSSANTMLRDLRTHLASKQGSALKRYWSNSTLGGFLGADGGALSDFRAVVEAMLQLQTMVPANASGNSDADALTDQAAKQSYAVGLWTQVKMWELMNAFGLEGFAVDAHPEAGEKRAWFSRQQFVSLPLFSIAEARGRTMGLTQVNYEYLRNGWGHLELALVSGHRVCSAYVCYEARHKATLQSDSSKYEGGMLLLWGLKAMEEHDTGRGPMLSEGFSFLSANPLAALEIEGPVASAWWKDPAHPDRSRALSVAAQVFAEKIGTWTVETWRDRNYGKSETGANFLDDTRVVSGHLGNEVSQRSIADNLWHTLPSWSGVGVHPALVNAFARFGLAMWPRNDWMSRGKPLAAAAPAAPTATASNASVKIEWSGNATTHNVYRATNASGPWLAIALLRRGSSIADVAVQKGTTYYYAVSANTPTSESNLSSATSATP